MHKPLMNFCNMKTYLVLFSFILLFATTLSAQKKVLIEIGPKKITLDEFERIYQKNNTQLSDESEIKTPEEYLDMFINFKIKVVEAESRGLDTVRSFVNELAGYRNELTRPYLTDVSVADSMVKLAYYRTVNEVNASHILLTVNENATPEDTLIAYNKIMAIREQYLSGGQSFEDLAKANSEDPSAATNGGNLGYFRAFQMITPFENTAFETQPGTVSMPVRTRFGYHLVYTKDIRPIKPDIKVAHIMKMFANPQAITEEEANRLKVTIDSIYQLVLAGQDFGELAQKFSDDRRSANNNGEMNWIGSSFGVPEFTEAAYSLQNIGDISGVVRTGYGWHIIKKLDIKPIPSFEDLREQLTNQVKADPMRSAYSKTVFVNKLKKEYAYTKNNKAFDTFTEQAKARQIDSLSADLPDELTSIVLFTLAGKTYTMGQYIDFLRSNKPGSIHTDLQNLDKNIGQFEEEAITKYEDSRLESKYPDFAALMQEYHDGILLFTIMEDMVWNKAMSDSTGLELFYQKNKGLFKLGEHYDGLLAECTTIEAKEKAESLIAAGETDPKNIEAQINTENETLVKITKGRWENGDNDLVSYFIWGAQKPASLDETLVFVSGEKKTGGEKTLEEARGLYVSEYQDYLEKEWIKELRNKYPVKTNMRLLKKVKSVK